MTAGFPIQIIKPCEPQSPAPLFGMSDTVRHNRDLVGNAFSNHDGARSQMRLLENHQFVTLHFFVPLDGFLAGTGGLVGLSPPAGGAVASGSSNFSGSFGN